MCWSNNDLSSIFRLVQIVNLWVKTKCFFMGNMMVIKSLIMSQM